MSHTRHWGSGVKAPGRASMAAARACSPWPPAAGPGTRRIPAMGTARHAASGAAKAARSMAATPQPWASSALWIVSVDGAWGSAARTHCPWAGAEAGAGRSSKGCQFMWYECRGSATGLSSDCISKPWSWICSLLDTGPAEGSARPSGDMVMAMSMVPPAWQWASVTQCPQRCPTLEPETCTRPTRVGTPPKLAACTREAACVQASQTAGCSARYCVPSSASWGGTAMVLMQRWPSSTDASTSSWKRGPYQNPASSNRWYRAWALQATVVGAVEAGTGAVAAAAGVAGRIWQAMWSMWATMLSVPAVSGRLRIRNVGVRPPGRSTGRALRLPLRRPPLWASPPPMSMTVTSARRSRSASERVVRNSTSPRTSSWSGRPSRSCSCAAAAHAISR
mmetsp:Transcript_52956/g.94467  ORF Transcript_52956/g.94467 Transcript_52956/m.94467 type:complete len:393 (-) Transcript_52956:4372-5550(-)